MIFIGLGTKRFQFNRLLKEVDQLIDNDQIDDYVIAQIGHSDYIPQYFDYKNFISPEEYNYNVNEADIVITHGGTGAIVKALKAHKQVIAIPRRAYYGEHSDDHQLQIVDFFTQNGYVKRVDEVDNLGDVIFDIMNNPIERSFESKGNIIEIIDNFIMNE